MISENAEKIQDKLGLSVILVAVTKGRSSDQVLSAYKAGVKIFGENRVQEAQKKYALLPVPRTQYELHMIGHLQTNKVKNAVFLFDMIQSVDSLRLLRSIELEARRIGKVMRVLIQVNISKDPKKYGIMPEYLFEFFRQAHELLCSPYLVVEGLMTIVEHTEDVEKRRPYFRAMKNIFDDIKNLFDNEHIENVRMRYLSMGMSEDFEVAVSSGANMVRVGRALFVL